MAVLKIAMILLLWIPFVYLIILAAGDIFHDVLNFQRKQRQESRLSAVPPGRSSYSRRGDRPNRSRR